MHTPAAFKALPPNDNGSHGTAFDQFRPPAPIAAFAKSLRRLTNYEVWERAESAILDLSPDPDSTAQDWRRIEMVLDELRWRLSGLEGAGPPTPQLAVTVSTGAGE